MAFLNIVDVQFLNIVDVQLLNIIDAQLLNIADAQLLNYSRCSVTQYSRCSVTQYNDELWGSYIWISTQIVHKSCMYRKLINNYHQTINLPKLHPSDLTQILPFRSTRSLVLYVCLCGFLYICNVFIVITSRRVRTYQRGNQNPYIEEEQTTQWSKAKVQKGN
jgi:hypothetical protein